MSRLKRARERLAGDYRRSLPAKAAVLREALYESLSEEERAASIRRLAHQLRGSGGSFGFPRITEAASLVEEASPEKLAHHTRGLIDVLMDVGREPADDTSARILIVEDDADTIRLLRNAFCDTGHRVEVVCSLRNAQRTVSDAPPDLIILDLTLLDADGRELLASRPVHLEGLPVFVVSADQSGKTQRECLALGADAYFTKPLDLTALVVAADRILLRQRRADVPEVDHLTGLPTRGALERRFDQVRAMASRANTPMSLALLDIDHFKAINDNHGHRTGDIVLERVAAAITSRLRQSDLAARWGGEEFLLLFADATPDKAEIPLRSLRQSLRRMAVETSDGTLNGVTFSGGIVAISPTELLETATDRADALLYRAKHTGRDRVLVEGRQSEERPTVLIVEDDAMMAQKVVLLLEEHGYAADVASTGPEALERASSGSRYVLFILDQGLPERMTGLEILGNLRKTAGFRKTPAIMLTGSSALDQMEDAFELGIDDYLVKPFRERELIARIGRLVRPPADPSG